MGAMSFAEVLDEVSAARARRSDGVYVADLGEVLCLLDRDRRLMIVDRVGNEHDVDLDSDEEIAQRVMRVNGWPL